MNNKEKNNSGDRNSGNCNPGRWNSGNHNSGNHNSGRWNSGRWNSGNHNSGKHNSRNHNSGSWNSGDRNSGNHNSGRWNSCDNETGHFNTEQSTTIRVFNKPCDVTTWNKAYKPSWLYFSLTEWVDSIDMTDEEKQANPSHVVTGGYLKTLDYKEAFFKSYESASREDRLAVTKLPNFDPEVFYELSGILVEEEKCRLETVVVDEDIYQEE